ncbi:MAG: hypothetical protein QMD44_05030 [Thermodesulfovibrionales bacterium]|jgi:Ca2+-binding RTX toxin-like protein|nr:hypothetical protein [Thermodesulfovibrionales bacterium]
MPRIVRIAPSDNVHHILTRGNNRQNIFKEENNYMKYMEILQKYKEKYRYGSNRDGQHASRRYAEAHLFGLYDSGSTFTDPNEAKEVIRMFMKHKDTILQYEKDYPPSVSGYAGTITDIKPAGDYLITNFGQGKTIDNIIVGAGLDSYAYLEQSSLDKITGTTYNDLIFGEKGSDILEGGGGEDYIEAKHGGDEFVLIERRAA